MQLRALLNALTFKALLNDDHFRDGKFFNFLDFDGDKFALFICSFIF